jgi:hypothetical protein
MHVSSGAELKRRESKAETDFDLPLLNSDRYSSFFYDSPSSFPSSSVASFFVCRHLVLDPADLLSFGF